MISSHTKVTNIFDHTLYAHWIGEGTPAELEKPSGGLPGWAAEQKLRRLFSLFQKG